MTYLFLSLLILGGLVAIGYLVRAVRNDLRTMEDEDKTIEREIERWRAGK